MADIVDRLRTAETAPLDADGKVALFLVLQDARDEIARLREEREQIMRRRWVVRCGFYDDATTILDAIRAVRPPLVIEWTAEDGVVDQVERMQPMPSPQPGGEVEAAQATRGSGDEIARLSAERDAAIRERDAAIRERDQEIVALKSRVAELEANANTATILAKIRDSEWAVASELAAEANAELSAASAARGWLTAEEREAVEATIVDLDGGANFNEQRFWPMLAKRLRERSATLRGLLERMK